MSKEPKLTNVPPKPLTRIELDFVLAGSKCTDPGCHCGGKDEAKEISIVCSLHQAAGVRLRYSNGLLKVLCSECGHGVARVSVAHRDNAI